MKRTILRNTVFAIALILLTAFTTCSVVNRSGEDKTTTSDSLLLHQWRKEKERTEALVVLYEAQLTALRDRNDSLLSQVVTSKKAMTAYRFKADFLQRNLKEALAKKTDTTGKVSAKELIPVVDSLVANQVQSDSVCDSVISGLESVIANRDSAIVVLESVETALRDLGKEQELRTAYLTEQLNTAFKSQRKKARQNKILAGGILILSGITTSLLLTHALQ